jgi:hypothetical protein
MVAHHSVAFSVIISILVFCNGFASALVIGSTFVSDTWGGHYLVKQFFFTRHFSEVFVDWIFFAFFIFFPVLVLCTTLLAGIENWWTIAALFWFGCVALFYVIFALSSVFYEVQGAIKFMRRREDANSQPFLDVCKSCIKLRQTNKYSGKKRTRYLARSAFHSEGEPILARDIFEPTREEHISYWAKFTLWRFVSTNEEGGLQIFKRLEHPYVLHTIDDVLDNRPFVTKYTWSLERFFCRPKNSRYVAIIHGPGALTKNQIYSSFICSAIGTMLLLLLMTSCLVWLELPKTFIIIIVLASILYAWNSLKSERRLAKIAKQALKQETEGNGNDPENSEVVLNEGEHSLERMPSRRASDSDETPNGGVYLVSLEERVTEAKEHLCWIMLGLELAVFFVYPIITLFALRNWITGLLFIIITAFENVRHYINLICVIEETGNMNRIDGVDAKDRWVNQSRLSHLIVSITSDKSRIVWHSLMTFLGVIYLALFFGALGDTADPTFDQELTFLDDFYYPAQPMDIRYSTCSLGGTTTGNMFGENATLADFAFLSALPYLPDEIATKELVSWFRGIEVVEDKDTVDEYRNRTDSTSSLVFFRLFRFKTTGKDKGVISIRGTQNNWDLLADNQLWIAAISVQVLRAILPVGEMWTPILDGKFFSPRWTYLYAYKSLMLLPQKKELVRLINAIQSTQIAKVSFYKVRALFFI